MTSTTFTRHFTFSRDRLQLAIKADSMEVMATAGTSLHLGATVAENPTHFLVRSVWGVIKIKVVTYPHPPFHQTFTVNTVVSTGAGIRQRHSSLSAPFTRMLSLNFSLEVKREGLEYGNPCGRPRVDPWFHPPPPSPLTPSTEPSWHVP